LEPVRPKEADPNRRSWPPFVTLTARPQSIASRARRLRLVAMATKNLKMATGVCLVVEAIRSGRQSSSPRSARSQAGGFCSAIVGGAFPQWPQRAIRYGNGLVSNASGPNYADVTEFLPQFRQMAVEAGRDLTVRQSRFSELPRTSIAYSGIATRELPGSGGPAVGTCCRDPAGTN
jgi:hypothetical protein